MNLSFEAVLAREGQLVYTCVGASMLPLLRQRRDLIVIEKPSKPLQRYDVPLYRRADGKYVLHRILAVRKDGYVLCGDNQWRRERRVTDEQVIGVMTAVVRDGETIFVTDKRYRLYVHLWCDLFWLRVALLWCLSLPGRIKRKMQGSKDSESF